MNTDEFETFFMVFRFYQPKKQYDNNDNNDKEFITTIGERLLWICSRGMIICYY